MTEQQKPVFVKYVGKKLLKKDTVCRTNTVWAGFGDIQLVPRNVALQLVRHPKVWKPASAEEVAAQEAELLGEGIASSSAVVASVTSEQAGLRAADEEEEAAPKDRREVGQPRDTNAGIATAAAAEDAEEDDGPAPVQAAPVEEEEQEEPAAEETPADEPSDEIPGTQPDIDLVSVLSNMPKDDEHFSASTGKPLIAKVREIAGNQSITAVAVKKAWESLNG